MLQTTQQVLTQAKQLVCFYNIASCHSQLHPVSRSNRCNFSFARWIKHQEENLLKRLASTSQASRALKMIMKERDKQRSETICLEMVAVMASR